MDAQRPWLRARLAALSKTQTDGRAVVRQHQAQQRRLPVPPTRPNQGAPRLAIANDDLQPQQDSPPPARRRGRLNRLPDGQSAPHDKRGHSAAPTAVAPHLGPPTPLRDSLDEERSSNRAPASGALGRQREPGRCDASSRALQTSSRSGHTPRWPTHSRWVGDAHAATEPRTRGSRASTSAAARRHAAR